jgi:tripartite-type tricarboxylate transporter receptor subunit TctC
MKNKASGRLSVSLCLALVLLLCAGMAAYSGGQNEPVPAEEFYKGKTINFIVTNEAGSGFDTYTRAVAPYLQKYIPGSKVIVTNMPDAGGIIGQNKTYTAKPNGLTICMTSGAGMMFSQVRGLPGVKFDLQKHIWLGRVASEVHVMIVSKNSPFRSFQDLMSHKEPFKFAASGVGSDDYISVAVITQALDLPLEQIVGYEEGGEWLAIVKGEVWGGQGSWGSTRQFIESGDAIPILQITTERSSLLPDVPAIVEVVDEKNKALATAVASIFAFDRVICAPPGVPEDRVKMLREALRKTFEDPGYQEDLKKLKRVHVPATGEETEAIMKQAFAQAGSLAAVLATLPVVEED